MNKRTVTEIIDHDLSFFDLLDKKSPDEVIQKVKEYKDQYPDREIIFDVSHWGYDGGIDLSLIGTRLETDAEYNKRLKAEQKEREKISAAKAKSDEQDRKTYERLKKKFER